MTNYDNASHALPLLLHKVMDKGYDTPSRNGKCRELTMQQITLTDPDLYITTPGRRVSLPAQIAETMWLLAGRNDIEWLSHYLPRAKDFSDDGKTWRGGYGPRLRAWESRVTVNGEYAKVDQLAHVVHLLKEDPTTRRAVLAIYDPSVDTKPGKDIPCNNWVHLLPRDGVLHAHVAIRSNDLFWGWSGINAFEWTALLQVVAGLTGLQPGSITFSISSLHLYEKHWGRAQAIVDAPVGTELYNPSPEFSVGGFHPGAELPGMADFDDLVQRWFSIEEWIRFDRWRPDLARLVQEFPEPLMRSWLYVLLAWNKGDLAMAGHLQGTALFAALGASPKRKVAQAVSEIEAHAAAKARVVNRPAFTVFATKLHAEKNAAYGDSWKKRGEMLGIMANIARKVDRLGVAGGGDTAADTAIDLMMYLIKYNLWLRQQAGAQDAPTAGQSHVHAVDFHLQQLERFTPGHNSITTEQLTTHLREMFDRLEHLVEEKRATRSTYVEEMLQYAYPLAVRLWAEEQALTPKGEWQAGNATRPFNGYAALDHANEVGA